MKTRLVIKGDPPAWAAVLALALSLASTGAPAALLSVSNGAGATAEEYGTGIPPGSVPPDFQSASVFGDTGPVTSSVSADRGAASRFAVGHAVSSGTVDLGYFAGTADSTGIVPRGIIDTDGTGREYEYFASSSADVVADSWDQIFVMPASPFLVGTLATLVVPIDVSGTLSATLTPDVPRGHLRSDSAAQVIWTMTAGAVGGNASAMLWGTVDTFGTGYGDMPGLHTLTFDVPLGVPTTLLLHYELHTTAGIGSALGVGGSVEGLAAFGSTFRWMGISQLLDADGNPIDFSIVSDSGFDWTQAAPTPSPVPVPPLALSLLAAFSASAARYGRRRRG